MQTLGEQFRHYSNYWCSNRDISLTIITPDSRHDGDHDGGVADAGHDYHHAEHDAEHDGRGVKYWPAPGLVSTV